MITNTRLLTELEKETWDVYEYVLDSIPNGRMYDRVSVHNEFPDVKAAFEKVQQLQTYYKLMDKNE